MFGKLRTYQMQLSLSYFAHYFISHLYNKSICLPLLPDRPDLSVLPALIDPDLALIRTKHGGEKEGQEGNKDWTCTS